MLSDMDDLAVSALDRTSSFGRRLLVHWKIGLIGAAILLFAFVFGPDRSAPQSFVTDKIIRGQLANTITATGTLEPEEVIDVGAQVAGLILSFGEDSTGRTIDFGSKVEEGTVLARIDDSLYQSDVRQAEAQLIRAKADREQLQAKLRQAERDWKRAERLGASNTLSPSSLDAYLATYETAVASVKGAEAQILQAESAFSKAKRNLDLCTIRSPVRGVIIDKRVNVGQTVVSSLNAPSLFLLARDLRRMEVWVSVNEADIGNIRPGQSVSFTVDAFPGEQFVGTVEKVRLNASVAQNVVTFVVEVTTDNSSGRLLPYLTVNARFEVDQKENVLLAPSGALRWKPPHGESGEESASRISSEPAVWILRNGKPVRTPVIVGASNGEVSEIGGAGVHEGAEVIIGVRSSEDGATTPEVKNPFAPQMPRGRRNV